MSDNVAAMIPRAATLLLLALSAGCSSSVVEPGSTTTSSTTDSTSSSTTTSSTTTTTTSSTTTSTTTTTTTTTSNPCAALGCAAGQLCVVPVCMPVAGEICIFGSMDAGAACPPGTKHSSQFDGDCPDPGFACVDGCPPAAPFCLDVPAACNGSATCACLGADPCMAVNGGKCHDAAIGGGELACSLDP